MTAAEPTRERLSSARFANATIEINAFLFEPDDGSRVPVRVGVTMNRPSLDWQFTYIETAPESSGHRVRVERDPAGEPGRVRVLLELADVGDLRFLLASVARRVDVVDLLPSEGARLNRQLSRPAIAPASGSARNLLIALLDALENAS